MLSILMATALMVDETAVDRCYSARVHELSGAPSTLLLQTEFLYQEELLSFTIAREGWTLKDGEEFPISFQSNIGKVEYFGEGMAGPNGEGGVMVLIPTRDWRIVGSYGTRITVNGVDAGTYQLKGMESELIPCQTRWAEAERERKRQERLQEPVTDPFG